MTGAHPKIAWPGRWQQEAIDAVLPYLGTDERLRILVDDPKKAKSGSLIERHVYVENGIPMIIHDRSGRPDVYPGEVLLGPVLRVELIRPRKPALVLYANPDWTPPAQR